MNRSIFLRGSSSQIARLSYFRTAVDPVLRIPFTNHGYLSPLHNNWLLCLGPGFLPLRPMVSFHHRLLRFAQLRDLTSHNGCFHRCSRLSPGPWKVCGAFSVMNFVENLFAFGLSFLYESMGRWISHQNVRDCFLTIGSITMILTLLTVLMGVAH